MKKWYHLLCLLILSSFASYGQNVYQHFSELNGMEDYNANTNLLYRINLHQYSNYYDHLDNSIYLLNVKANSDSLFQSDFNDFNLTLSSRSVAGYDFWDKDPHKFIVCGADGSGPLDLNFTLLDRFDKSNLFNQWGWVQFIGISRQNDSLVYCTYSGYGLQLFKSTTGGMTWDTVSNFEANSLSPYNDKVLFTTSDNKLIKTTDGGLTQSVVDSILLNANRSDQLFYDKDSNYIYSAVTIYLDNRVYKLSVSNHKGDANTWQVKFTSPSQIYLSVDNAVTGSIYLATGRYIYHSTDFGNTFSLFQTFDRKLVGMYKKPGSSKLYAATYNTIYELDGPDINIIKKIPLDKEIFKYDPLDIGNKWVYKGTFFVPEDQHSFVQTNEVIKDTVMANQQSYKLIQSIRIDNSTSYIQLGYFYERIDSLTGKVYAWEKFSGTEHQIDDLSSTLGDSINVSRFGLVNGPTSFDSLYFKNVLGMSKEYHVFHSLTNPLGYGDRYSLSKDLGLTYRLSSDDQIFNEFVIKGAVIKGIVYGDTSTIVGITDKTLTPPKEYVLSQNYPNPFNPNTVISYSLPSASNIILIVYNTIGQTVKVLQNGFRNAGNYSVTFNASGLPSGIYFYKLEAGQFSKVKKMILIK